MDSCDAGSVVVDGSDVARYSPRELTEFRRFDIGFVFQFYNLVSNLTALENVELAAQIRREPKGFREPWGSRREPKGSREPKGPRESLDSQDILSRVGLAERTDNFPAQLSGGEQQRVAIARALAKRPKLLLCDEPTGALDYETGKSILSLLEETCRRDGMTVILITHNSAIAPMADKVIKIKSGRVERVTVNPSPTAVEDIEW